MPQQLQYTRRNILALGADFIFFTVGFVFWDPTVVIPSFVQELTGSTIAVGLLAALRILMVTFPQLWAASYLVGKPRKKPLLVWSSVGGRLPLLLLALATLWWAQSAAWLVVGLLGLTFAAFYTSEGLNSISWPDLVGKVVPARFRGRFLGYGQLVASLVSLGAGYLVHLVLSAGRLAYPVTWAVLFGCAFAGMMLSIGAILLVSEQPDPFHAGTVIDIRRDAQATLNCLRRDARLRKLIGLELLLGLAGAVFPFFVVRAQQVIGGANEMIGPFLIMQNLGGAAAALILGNLIDHTGSWLAIRVISVLQTACLVVVTLGTLLGLSWPAYLAAYMLLGFVSSGAWWSYTAYILDIAGERERPLYLAANGILLSLNALSSALMGVLMDVSIPELLFGTAALISAAGMAVAWTLPKAQRLESVASGIESMMP